MTKHAKVVGYVRHSKDEQGRRMSPALQRRAIEKWADAHDLSVDAWHTDSAPGSAAISKRAGLQTALAALGPGAVLVVYRLDRLARDLELQLRLFRVVTGAGARIISTADEGTNGLGDDDPDAIFLQQLQGALAQRERGVLAARIRDGVRAKKAEGRKWCCHAPYGFRWSADDKLAENAAEQRTVELCERLRTEGISFRGVVAELQKRRRRNRAGNYFTLSQVQRMLAR